jgi:hypothetical protein
MLTVRPPKTFSRGQNPAKDVELKLPALPVLRAAVEADLADQPALSDASLEQWQFVISLSDNLGMQPHRRINVGAFTSPFAVL